MREIVFDTETTGLDFRADRVVEIGAIELDNRLPTGATFHVYINPEREMPEEAFRVHGLSTDFLSDKPKFAEIAESFRAFVGDGVLVAHNASFDRGMINAEFARLGLPEISGAQIVDTLALARKKHPGAQNTLDALCSRYGVDTSRRTKHGALLDAELLALVYVELVGGRQAALGIFGDEDARGRLGPLRPIVRSPRRVPLAARLTQAEIDAHRAFVKTLGEHPLWTDYPEDA